jgi:Transposase DDE domain
MTLCRTSCGHWSSLCCRFRRGRPTAAGAVPSPTGPASPRSCSWPAPHPMAAAPGPGAGLRLTGDLLAPPGRVGEGRRVRPAPLRGPGSAGGAGPAGLVAGQRGHHERARQAWGDHVGANPVDRGKPGSKLHLVCDGGGLPLTVAVTAANVTDVPCWRPWSTTFHRAHTLGAARSTRQPRRRQGVRQPHQPGLAAAAWDPTADRSAWGGVVGQVGTAPLAGGAVAVMVELLQAAAGAVGPRFGPVVRVRAAGLCGRLLQPALTAQRERAVEGSCWVCLARLVVVLAPASQARQAAAAGSAGPAAPTARRASPASRKTASLSALAGRVAS